MLLAGVGTSLLLMAQICCSKWAFSFPSRNLLGFITAFAHCVSKGWAGVGGCSLGPDPSAQWESTGQ